MAWALVVVGLGGAACGDGGPVTPGENPCQSARVAYPTEVVPAGATEHVHDPEVVRSGAYYYVLSTNDGVPIRRSPDLLSWQFMGRVFPQQLPSWASGAVPGVEAPWAPAVHRFNGRYHLYYSLSTFGSPRSAIGLTTNVTLDPESPDYGWEDRGEVTASYPGTGYNAIDAAVVEDADGGLWLAWGSWWDGIKMRALDRETGLLSASDETLHSLARRPLEQAVEGAYLIRRGGYYYLFVSFDHCCQGVASTYNIRVGRSASVTGPYLDRTGQPMLSGGGSAVLTGYGTVRGPGHGSVLEEDGEYRLVHHFYDATAGGVPRIQTRPLLWDDDGWPVAGFAHDGTPPGPPPPGLDVTGRWGYWAGEDQAHEVILRSDGVAVTCVGDGVWSYEAPMLTLTWPASASPTPRVDRSILSSDGRSLAGRSPDGRIVRGYRLAGTS